MAPDRCATKRVASAWALCLALLAGCGPGAEASVSGQVTLDEAALDDATITFIPKLEGQDKAGWATVKDGKYEIPPGSGLGVGAFRVEIRAARSTGEKVNKIDPALPAESRESLPSRYNANSELSVEIVPGANTADFALKSN